MRSVPLDFSKTSSDANPRSVEGWTRTRPVSTTKRSRMYCRRRFSLRIAILVDLISCRVTARMLRCSSAPASIWRAQRQASCLSQPEA
eukprot:1820664-Rhodomonas_salina.2